MKLTITAHILKEKYVNMKNNCKMKIIIRENHRKI